MKIEYGLLGVLVVAALAPAPGWAEPSGSGSTGSAQQQAPGHGASEEQGARNFSPPGTGAGSVTGQSEPGASLRMTQGHGVASAPGAEAKNSVAATARPIQPVATPPLHGAKAAKPNTVSAASPNGIARQESVKAGASGRTASSHRNPPVAASSPQTGSFRPAPLAPGRASAVAPSAHVLAASRPSPSAPASSTVAASPAGAAARHTPVSAGVGGAASYPPRNGTLVVIGGTSMRRNKL